MEGDAAHPGPDAGEGPSPLPGTKRAAISPVSAGSSAAAGGPFPLAKRARTQEPPAAPVADPAGGAVGSQDLGFGSQSGVLSAAPPGLVGVSLSGRRSLKAQDANPGGAASGEARAARRVSFAPLDQVVLLPDSRRGPGPAVASGASSSSVAAQGPRSRLLQALHAPVAQPSSPAPQQPRPEQPSQQHSLGAHRGEAPAAGWGPGGPSLSGHVVYSSMLADGLLSSGTSCGSVHGHADGIADIVVDVDVAGSVSRGGGRRGSWCSRQLQQHRQLSHARFGCRRACLVLQSCPAGGHHFQQSCRATICCPCWPR